LRTANHAKYTNPESFRGNQSYCAETQNCGMKIFDKMSDSDGVQCREPKDSIRELREPRTLSGELNAILTSRRKSHAKGTKDAKAF
jgi:hypothetical protein